MATESTYRKLLDSLIRHCEKIGKKVDFVSDKRLKDYAGMNPAIGKVMGFTIRPDTILIDEKLSPKDKYETLLHELYEWGLMKKGMPYWEAHCKSLRIESKSRISVPYKPCKRMRKVWPQLATVKVR